MAIKGSERKKLLRLILSWLLLILAVLLGITGAVAAFLVAALLLSNTILLCILAILVCLSISTGLAWIAGKRIAPSHRGRFALNIGVGTCALVIFVSYFTVFKPLVPSSEISSPTVLPQTRFWDLPTGSRIAYLKIPAADKTNAEPIIFVHGGPGAGLVAVKPITDIFSSLTQEGYDVYFYDQIGGGLSARLENIREYTVSRHVADLEGIRQHIGAEKMILIGESWGGELATHYVVHYPENVKKLILVSPGELNPEEWGETEPCDLKGRVSEERRQEFNSVLGPRLILAYILLEINPDAARNFIKDKEGDRFISHVLSLLIEGMVCDPVNLPEEIHFDFGCWANIMTDRDEKAMDKNLEERLKSNPIPVLILKGECDYCLWEVTYQYKTLFPNSTLLYVRDAGHIIYLEKPGLFMDAVRAFLSDAPLPMLAYTDSSPPEK